jgi:cbb3-type cytochrome oxidase cytochrome c subunit
VKLRAGEWVVLGGSGVIAAFAALVGVLIYLKPPPVEYRYVETPAARDGEVIYRREGCNSCHRLFGNGATYGPSLDGVGSRRSADWLRKYLQDPKPGVSEKPYRVRMPSYSRLQSVELSALVAYLQGLRAVSAEGAPIDAPNGR